ncbi:DUF4303 domain-containing protein [Chryseobacterium pennipullorum]|uniref:DUF4303 domain-containing protein n=1 Tax=Chryseobacterium pennipullorum TaxID=2258963 RepID=A0A3D9AZE5_9FLAO|nr:DUF4303 domain-containing protein [Chryseobacterium pennipullorum]REC46745.1 hypothetical protein DRF67_13035 [Chryseobacterium pennipullorum]
MDFENLKNQIEEAAKKAFIEMFEKHGDENIYSFALYSDEGAMTVCPASNTLTVLEDPDEDDALYYKYEPAEWTYEMEGADDEFNGICTQLRAELESNENSGEWFESFRSQLYASCVEVLEKLKNENFFRNITGRDIFLLFTVSDYEFETEDLREIIIRLNDNEYRTEYLEWMDTWGS